MGPGSSAERKPFTTDQTCHHVQRELCAYERESVLLWDSCSAFKAPFTPNHEHEALCSIQSTPIPLSESLLLIKLDHSARVQVLCPHKLSPHSEERINYISCKCWIGGLMLVFWYVELVLYDYLITPNPERRKVLVMSTGWTCILWNVKQGCLYQYKTASFLSQCPVWD